jgi:hypothetical protein
LTGRLSTKDTVGVRHSEIEHILNTDGRETLRRLFEDHCRVRDIGDIGSKVVGADGVVRTHRRVQHRKLVTLYGVITIERLGYGARGYASLFPKDALLNLPGDSYSHGLRKLVAYEASKGPFSEVVRMVKQITGETIPKHTAEMLAAKAAIDFDAFYTRQKKNADTQFPLLILTTDGKGVVMRRADLREATRKAAETTQHKLHKRQSRGEKSHAKRMATVAAVYEIDRFTRTAEDVVKEMRADEPCVNRPRPVDKRVWASIEKESDKVTEDLFAEALRRDPEKKLRWICLIDGDQRQLSRVKTAARKYGVNLTIIMDIIHVIEYLWKAAWCFHNEGDPGAEQWVSERLLAILQGKAPLVAAGIRRSATRQRIVSKDRVPIDKCAGYLLKNKDYLQYHRHLRDGLPIATGVIEGACRHLIKDRMDVTGARWSLQGAEAILKLRSLRSSGDFEEYWKFHEEQEYERNHQRLYADIGVLDKLGNEDHKRKAVSP